MVVLPASMWAMIPMLRVRASGYSRMSSPLPFVTCCSVVATFIFSAGLAIYDAPPSCGTRPEGRVVGCAFHHQR